MAEEVDVVVVGLGVGGEEIAGKLAEAGLRVVGVEHRLVGGECPYWGCVPSKMMIRAANLLAEARRVDGMAGHARVSPDYAPVAARIRDEATDDWDDRVAVERFTGKGGQFIRGYARLRGPGRVEADGQEWTVRKGIVLATGTSPVVPPIPGLADTPLWTNREAVEAETLPDSLIVLGGGAIGLELAQAFVRFGVQVTVVEAADRLLATEEPESSKLALDALKADGATVHTGRKATRVRHEPKGFTLSLDDGTEIGAEKLLVCVGRKANLGDVGADTVGLDPKATAVAVDGHLRAGSGLWAVGDVTGHGAYTHMAMYQAGFVVRDILGKPGPAADYRAVPRVTFTDPEIAGVGLTEAQAREKGISVRTGTAQIPSSARGWIHKAGNSGFVKLVADSDEGVLVGATSAGPTGGEVLAALTLAVRTRTPLDTMRDTIYAYPTFHRAIEDALRDLG